MRYLRYVALLAFTVLMAGLTSVQGPADAHPGANGRIAFVRNDQGPVATIQRIYTMASDGMDVIPVTRGTDPTWSPDGLTIAYAFEHQIWTVGANGTGKSPVSFGDGERNSVHMSPTWSPDGSRIAFLNIVGGDADRIWSVNADGTRLHQVLDRRAVDPAWSPDGRWIAFAGNGIGTDWEIYAMRPNGDSLHAVTDVREPGPLSNRTSREAQFGPHPGMRLPSRWTETSGAFRHPVVSRQTSPRHPTKRRWSRLGLQTAESWPQFKHPSTAVISK